MKKYYILYLKLIKSIYICIALILQFNIYSTPSIIWHFTSPALTVIQHFDTDNYQLLMTTVCNICVYFVCLCQCSGTISARLPTDYYTSFIIPNVVLLKNCSIVQPNKWKILVSSRIKITVIHNNSNIFL